MTSDITEEGFYRLEADSLVHFLFEEVTEVECVFLVIAAGIAGGVAAQSSPAGNDTWQSKSFHQWLIFNAPKPPSASSASTCFRPKSASSSGHCQRRRMPRATCGRYQVAWEYELPECGSWKLRSGSRKTWTIRLRNCLVEPPPIWVCGKRFQLVSKSTFFVAGSWEATTRALQSRPRRWSRLVHEELLFPSISTAPVQKTTIRQVARLGGSSPTRWSPRPSDHRNVHSFCNPQQRHRLWPKAGPVPGSWRARGSRIALGARSRALLRTS